jgi:hypothetical protein
MPRRLGLIPFRVATIESWPAAKFVATGFGFIGLPRPTMQLYPRPFTCGKPPRACLLLARGGFPQAATSQTWPGRWVKRIEGTAPPSPTVRAVGALNRPCPPLERARSSRHRARTRAVGASPSRASRGQGEDANYRSRRNVSIAETPGNAGVSACGVKSTPPARARCDHTRRASGVRQRQIPLNNSRPPRRLPPVGQRVTALPDGHPAPSSGAQSADTGSPVSG